MIKNIFSIGTLFILLLSFVACDRGESDADLSPDSTSFKAATIVPDDAKIEVIMKGLDQTLAYKMNDKSIPDDVLSGYFESILKDNGLNVFTDPNGDLSKVVFSDEFYNIATPIARAYDFDSPEQYLSQLEVVNKRVLESTLLSTQDKQILVNRVALMKRVVPWLNHVTETYNYSDNKIQSCSGWWSCWGKCVAGTIGGAGLGAVGGAFAGGVGCTVVLPIIGTVACGTVGGIVGGVSGALAGAAASC